jgi:Holliday junction resolvase RusA-like endonuclease
MPAWTIASGRNGIAVSEPIVLTLFGTVPAKKNAYKKRVGRGKGMYKDEKVQEKLDRLAEQIPAELRGLNLVHPDITWEFKLPRSTKTYKPWDHDPDNKVTTLTDLFKSFGIFKDDKFRYHNGTKTVLPAVETDGVDEVTVTIIPKEKAA